MDGGWVMIWTEAFVPYFKLPFQHSPTETEVNHETNCIRIVDNRIDIRNMHRPVITFWMIMLTLAYKC